MDSTRKVHQFCVEKNTVVTGFKRLQMKALKGGQYIFYCQNPAEELTKQAAVRTWKKFVCNFGTANGISDSLNSEIGENAFPEVRLEIHFL